MLIAIDYDGTYSRFPEQFNLLRESFQSIGAKVFIVTARCPDMQIPDDLSAFDDVIYTANKAKAAVVDADIYIDDNPVTLCCDMRFEKDFIDATPASGLHQTHDSRYKWDFIDDKFIPRSA